MLVGNIRRMSPNHEDWVMPGFDRRVADGENRIDMMIPDLFFDLTDVYVEATRRFGVSCTLCGALEAPGYDAAPSTAWAASNDEFLCRGCRQKYRRFRNRKKWRGAGWDQRDLVMTAFIADRVRILANEARR